ncbi:MAG: FUSC family protein [Desulfobulbus sp.]
MNGVNRAGILVAFTQGVYVIGASLREEWPRWRFVGKTTFAALLAMWISMRFQLSQPVTAVITVFLIMQPQSGMVFTKSIYRTLGTLAGAFACLVLFALWPQQGACFLLGLACWVGLCTAGATLFRNFTCYGFVLAGYTAAMIGMPNVPDPGFFFDYAVGRCTEVMVGICCAGLVSDIVFPQNLGPAILGTVQQCYADFMEFGHALLWKREQPELFNRIHLRFIRNTLALESLRGADYWEANRLQRRDGQFRRLNADFMAMTTTAHSLHQLMRRLRKSGSLAAAALEPLLISLDSTLAGGSPGTLTLEAAQKSLRQMAAFRSALAGRAEIQRKSLEMELTQPDRIDFETGVELIRRVIGELHDFTRQYLALFGVSGTNGPDCHPPAPAPGLHFAARTDPVLAIMNGIRAMLAVSAVAWFWLLSGWPYGSYAVMMVAIACALFASTPFPVKAINMAMLGGCFALPVAFACKFFFLPSINGFALLSSVLGPVLLLSAWLMTRKATMIGLGFCCMFCFMIAPGNIMQYDPIELINFGLSQVLGQAAASIMFAVFAPATSPWFKRRLPGMLRRQIGLVCHAPLAGLAQRFESGTRDIMQRIAATGQGDRLDDQCVLEWMFLVLETGHALLDLRNRAAEELAGRREQKGVESVLRAIGALFDHPSEERRRSALSVVDHALEQLQGTPGQEQDDRALHALLPPLHSLRLTLLDRASVFQEGYAHAA